MERAAAEKNAAADITATIQSVGRPWLRGQRDRHADGLSGASFYFAACTGWSSGCVARPSGSPFELTD